MEPYYQDEHTEIWHGDCLEIMPTLGEFDCTLTDPPYGIGEAAGKNKSRSCMAVSVDYGDAKWDDKPATEEAVAAIIEASTNAIIFGGNYFALPPSSCWLVWDKDNGKNDFADCELAWTNLKKAVRMFKWRWQGMLQETMGTRKEDRVHPTQKPLAVMRWCLTHVPDAKTILDPFMGSGTTLLAAKLEGRKAVGIELEEKYCEIAAERLRQKVMF
jgi:DNA modification methylase